MALLKAQSHAKKISFLALLLFVGVSVRLVRPAAAFSAIVPSIPSGKLSSTRFLTQLLQSSSGDASDDDFMSSLRTRVSQVEAASSKMPLVVLDAMLPRQVLRLQVNNPSLMQLVRTRLQAENPHFGVLGMARLANGQQIYLKHGVEVRIENPEFVDEGVKLELVAGRRFEVDDASVEHVDGGWTEARINFLDSSDEIKSSQSTQERMAVARAISKAEQFDSPSANMDGNLSLVERWIELAKENEREVGQIDRLLECIGEIPPSDEPTERALWIGALINPLPAMGVATEIRPRLLTAQSAEQRVDVALEGILRSIRHMDGSAKMF